MGWLSSVAETEGRILENNQGLLDGEVAGLKGGRIGKGMKRAVGPGGTECF